MGYILRFKSIYYLFELRYFYNAKSISDVVCHLLNHAIRVLDEKGNAVFEPVKLKLDTEYEVLGFGNEKSSHRENLGFRCKETYSYEGHALAILKKNDKTSAVQVTMI